MHFPNYSWFQYSVIAITSLFFAALAGGALIAYSRTSHSTGMDTVKMQRIRVGQATGSLVGEKKNTQ